MNQTQQMIVMGIVFLLITGSIHYYLWVRMIRDAHLPSPWREIATVLLALLWLSLPIALIFSQSMTFDVSRIVSFAPYTWLGVMMLLFFAFLSVDVVKLAVFAVKKMGIPESAPLDASRRRLFGQLIAGTTVLTVAGMATAGVAQAARKAAVRRVPVKLRRLPKTLNGLKIVQISDLHIGITVGSRWLDDIVTRVNALEPDLVVITGDLIDGSADRLKQEIDPLERLTATYGTYFVTGNHEYYSGANRWIKEVEKRGVRVLRNESIPIGEGDEVMHLAGVDDYSAKGMLRGHGQDIRKAVRHIPEDTPIVLLAHQPKAVHEASDHGVDLVLSGHTHGGQIWPFNYLVGLQQPYNKGWHQYSDTTQIYVNQGTFMWGPPMRLGTECEITELTLTAA